MRVIRHRVEVRAAKVRDGRPNYGVTIRVREGMRLTRTVAVQKLVLVLRACPTEPRCLPLGFVLLLARWHRCTDGLKDSKPKFGDVVQARVSRVRPLLLQSVNDSQTSARTTNPSMLVLSNFLPRRSLPPTCRFELLSRDPALLPHETPEIENAAHRRRRRTADVIEMRSTRCTDFANLSN